MPAEETGLADGPTVRSTFARAAAAVGVISAVLVAIAFRSSPLTAVGLVAVVAVSARLAVIDVREHRLPNAIVGPLALTVGAGVIVAGLLDDDLARSGRALAFGLVLSTALFLVSLLGSLGMGDVKYALPMGATVGWFGLDALLTALLAMSFVGGVAAVVLLTTGRGRGTHLPYGPFMALGLVVGLLVSAPW